MTRSSFPETGGRSAHRLAKLLTATSLLAATFALSLPAAPSHAAPTAFIHDVQGNGAATPIAGASVDVEGVVVGDFQASDELNGFFLQEEDADVDADPATSEGVFVSCGACNTAVAEGQRVEVQGSVGESSGRTEIISASVAVTQAGNNLAQITPSPIDLPIAGDVDAFYEARESMVVVIVDQLTVSDVSELSHFGQLTLTEGTRPSAFTETNAPSVAGLAAFHDSLRRRQIIVDDDDDDEQSALLDANGMQAVYLPRANGGFSVGTQGTDFVRAGDVVSGLSGVVDWSSPGIGAATWRLRPRQSTPAMFTVANPRPAVIPTVGGVLRAASLDLGDYFTTIDNTSSSVAGPCGPSATADCRGADSVAELNRQRERESIVICSLGATVIALTGLENTTATTTIVDLLGAVNARCGGSSPFTFVNTGGTLGVDAARVMLIYRTGIVSPVGPPLVDLDPVHTRPPTAQTFDVVDATSPAFGERFTTIVVDFKSRDCPGTGPDADAGDGQGCFNALRVSQAERLSTWITGTVLPAAGDPDVLILGDVESYTMEAPIAALAAAGYTRVAAGTTGYDDSTAGLLGHLGAAFASASFAGNVVGAASWHINADESSLFDYSDETRDTGESAAEEKPDGSALVPPRVVYQPASPYRNSARDPIVVSLFRAATTTTITASPNPSTFGQAVTFTATISTGGDPVASGTVSFTEGVTTLASNVPVNGSGQATFTTTTLAVGNHPITATFNATTDFETSSGTVTQTVNKIATTTALTPSPNPSTFGQAVTFTATVTTSGNPVTSGTVSFSDGATVLATIALDGTGQAAFTTSILAVGDHPMTATFNGTTTVATSTSTPTTQTVMAIATTTALASSDSTTTFGQAVTFTAAVTGGGNPVTAGTVTFRDGITVLAPIVLDGTGQAAFTTSTLAVGTHLITATFDGNANFATSTSGPLTQAVDGVADAGGPYTIDEGDDLVLDGTGSLAGASATYSWDVNGDGTFGDATGATPTLAWTDLEALGIDGTGAPRTITLRLTEGPTFTAVTALTVDNVAPTATLSNDGPVPEGSTATVAFTGQDDPSSSDLAALVYTYDFDNDGTIDLTSPSPSATVPASFIADGPGTRTVRAVVADDDGGSLQLTTDIQIINAAPTAALTGPSTATVGIAVTFKVGADDPSPADLTGTFAFTVDWGDGTPVLSLTGPADPPVTHTYSTAGTFTVTATATDPDGATSAPLTTTITVAQAAPTTTTEPSSTTSSTTTTPGTTTTTTATGPSGGNLPPTGGGIDGALLAGIALLLAGAAVATAAARRSRNTATDHGPGG